MNPERYAQKRIDEAIATGDLESTVGVGKPIKNLSNDPDWWVRAFLAREELPRKQAEFRSHIDQLLGTAIAAPELNGARTALSTANHEISRWNDGVETSFHIDPISEIWLIEERAKPPGG
ncbi:MAG: DUF1992 domain-containing protein [Actinomycetia bacterium]|nr:DUF1992 domain-containing protein [Actinomycetes bacterium]